ncbi:MAG: hypothetical protein AAF349_18450 [Cyanobacteria bacterium P01_A01_bin.68]
MALRCRNWRWGVGSRPRSPEVRLSLGGRVSSPFTEGAAQFGGRTSSPQLLSPNFSSKTHPRRSYGLSVRE